jgi:hypothetical protein
MSDTPDTPPVTTPMEKRSSMFIRWLGAVADKERDIRLLALPCPVCGAASNQHCIRQPEDQINRTMYQSEFHYSRGLS